MTEDMRDIDPVETQEWREAVEDVIERDGPARAHALLDTAVAAARENGANLPFGATTAYQNSIPADQQPAFPGDLDMEWRIRTINRWNAMATVVRRNKVSSEYGGHIASFASSAVMYEPPKLSTNLPIAWNSAGLLIVAGSPRMTDLPPPSPVSATADL